LAKKERILIEGGEGVEKVSNWRRTGSHQKGREKRIQNKVKGSTFDWRRGR